MPKLDLIGLLAVSTIPVFKTYKTYQYTEVNALASLGDNYVVSVCREDDGWIVFAAEHEATELAEMYDTPLYHKTKKAAIALMMEFCQDFYDCCFEELYKND